MNTQHNLFDALIVDFTALNKRQAHSLTGGQEDVAWEVDMDEVVVTAKRPIDPILQGQGFIDPSFWGGSSGGGTSGNSGVGSDGGEDIVSLDSDAINRALDRCKKQTGDTCVPHTIVNMRNIFAVDDNLKVENVIDDADCVANVPGYTSDCGYDQYNMTVQDFASKYVRTETIAPSGIASALALGRPVYGEIQNGTHAVMIYSINRADNTFNAFNTQYEGCISPKGPTYNLSELSPSPLFSASGLR